MSPTLTEVQQYGSLIPVMWVDMGAKKGFLISARHLHR